MLTREITQNPTIRIIWKNSQRRNIMMTNCFREKNPSENQNHYQPDAQDEFEMEFIKNQISLSTFQKYFLAVGSSLAAIADPKRQDMICSLGETTGEYALKNIHNQMKNNLEGQEILREKPRIHTKKINIEKLKALPENTFGRVYLKFLEDNGVTPDSRMPVKFIKDSELGYVMTRYRECHDLIHTVLGMPTNMLGEVAVKWVEALNIGLPMCYGAAIFGAVRLKPKQRSHYKSTFLPWAVENGKNMKPLMSVYWEKRWEQDVNELRKELNIKIL